MDIWGEPSVTAEAELIAAAFAALDGLGLEPGDVRMRVNSRTLLEETLRGRFLARRPEAFQPLCVQIDKLEKIGPQAVADQLSDPAGDVGLDRAEAEAVVELLSVRELDEAARRVPGDSKAIADLRRLFELLEAYGVRDRVVFDASVVRGLAYYTGVVFEAFDAAGGLRSICGGGRYDDLLASLGGKPIPAAGFGFGDAVVLELLAEKKRLPPLRRELDAAVYAFGEEERPAAIRLANQLRRRGSSVELVLGALRLRRVLADADRAGAARVYLIGPEERARGVARVRDLRTGEERDEALPG